jgi:hypothetical protein
MVAFGFVFILLQGSIVPTGGGSIWNALASNPWAVTIAGGVAVLLIGWTGRRLFFGAKQQESAATTVLQTVSPSVTQNLQPTINIHTAPASALVLPQVAEHNKAAYEETAAPPMPRFEYRGPREKAVYINPYAYYGITDPRNNEELKNADTALCLRFLMAA